MGGGFPLNVFSIFLIEVVNVRTGAMELDGEMAAVSDSCIYFSKIFEGNLNRP